MPFKWLYPESTPFQEWRDDCYLNPGGFAQHGTWYESRNGDLASRVKHWPIRGSVPAKGLTIHIYHILSGYIWLVVPTFLKNCKNIWDNPSIIYVMKYTYIYIYVKKTIITLVLGRSDLFSFCEANCMDTQYIVFFWPPLTTNGGGLSGWCPGSVEPGIYIDITDAWCCFFGMFIGWNPIFWCVFPNINGLV